MKLANLLSWGMPASGCCLAGLLLGACVESTTTNGVETTVSSNPAGSPDNSKALSLMRMADETKSKGDNSTAVALYQKVIQEHPNVSGARTSLGEALLDNNDPDQALRHFADASKIDPNDIKSLIGAGQAYMIKNEPRKAKLKFEAALKKEPNNLTALTGLGVSCDAIGAHDEAQKSYRAVLKIDASHKAARNNYGLSLILSGQHKKAMAQLVPLAKEEGMTGRKARQNISMSYAMQGDLVAASRWSQVDLKPEEIRNNLRVYGSIE